MSVQKSVKSFGKFDRANRPTAFLLYFVWTNFQQIRECCWHCCSNTSVLHVDRMSRHFPPLRHWRQKTVAPFHLHVVISVRKCISVYKEVSLIAFTYRPVFHGGRDSLLCALIQETSKYINVICETKGNKRNTVIKKASKEEQETDFIPRSLRQ